jgi:hypothetical protein
MASVFNIVGYYHHRGNPTIHLSTVIHDVYLTNHYYLPDNNTKYVSYAGNHPEIDHIFAQLLAETLTLNLAPMLALHDYVFVGKVTESADKALVTHYTLVPFIKPV